MPSPDDFDYAAVRELCRKYRHYSLMVGNPGAADMINTAGMIRSVEQVLVDLMSDDPACLRFMERKNEIQLKILERALEAAAGAIDLLWIGEDLGTQRGPMISLDLYRRQIRPRHQPFVDLGRHFGIPVMIHSCGSSSWAFKDFIAMGISVVDTLQPEALNMAPRYLKETFGGELSFHGCISTAGVVANGTVEETREMVCRTLEIMKPGGGYALSPTHMLQDNTPTENAVAMYEEAKRSGEY